MNLSISSTGDLFHWKHLRVIALRADVGHFVSDPQQVYDFLCEPLRQKQVPIPGMFWVSSEDEFLVIPCVIFV